jgi:hypothetical protein
MFDDLSRPEVAVGLTDLTDKYRAAWRSARAGRRRMKQRAVRAEQALELAVTTLRARARKHGADAQAFMKQEGGTIEDATVAYSVSDELRRVSDMLEHDVLERL